jgi:hypothetical protein
MAVIDACRLADIWNISFATGEESWHPERSPGATGDEPAVNEQ